MIIISASIMLLIAVKLDLEKGRIPNKYNGFWLTYGLIMSFVNFGIKGLFVGIVGALLPMVGLMFLFAFGIIGAGDIKLFGALGAFVGIDIVWVVWYSFLLCGICGGIMILIRVVKGLLNGSIRKGIIELLTNNRQYTKVAFSIFIAGGFVCYLLRGGLGLGI